MEKEKTKKRERIMRRGGKRSIILIICSLVAVVALLVSGYASVYRSYLDAVMQEHMQQLHTAVKTAANSLGTHMSGHIQSMGILTDSPGFREEYIAYWRTGDIDTLRQYLLSYQATLGSEALLVQLVDFTGEPLLEHTLLPDTGIPPASAPELRRLANRGVSGIGPVLTTLDERNAVPLVKCFYIADQYAGALITYLDIGSLYAQFISPASVGRNSYLSIKDNLGVTIMHPSGEQLGLNAFTSYQRNPGLFSPEYTNMLITQYQKETGELAYYANWMGDPSLPKTTILEAYCHMPIGDRFWVVSALQDYNMLLSDVRRGLTSALMLSIALLGAVTLGTIYLFALLRNKKRLERETTHLRELNEVLQDLNSSQEQLRHSQKMQTIGTFTSGIAHEFNNLLTPILGYAEMLEEELQDQPGAVEDIVEIRRAGEKAQEIVNQILPFSRRESSGYAPTPIREVLQDVAGMVRVILPPTIEFVTDIEDTTARVPGSRTQLHQLFMNLCSNAYQSMKQTGGRLALRLRAHAAAVADMHIATRLAAEEYVEVVIADTGCGMEADLLERIFDPFFTTKVAGSGTGLGLAVVQAIVEDHAGYIEVESTPGAGSRFTVYLPLTHEALPEAAAQPKEQAAPVGKLSILFVDDDPAVARLFNKRLHHMGFEAEVFTDPGAALRAFQDNPAHYDLVITDYTMPRMKGSVLAKAIKRIKRDTPVILISGLMNADTNTLKADGPIDAVLKKPMTDHTLYQAISALAGGGKTGG